MKDSLDTHVGTVLDQVEESETGMVLFIGEDQVVVVLPPFPLGEDLRIEGAAVHFLMYLLNMELTIGLILVRLGRYAVGVMKGRRLVKSKTSSRYVKNRHRAGGSSQRRFERSRERLVRELYDATCELVQNIFLPYKQSIDYIFLGGERHVLRGFVQRCSYLKLMKRKTLKRILQIENPGQKELNRIHREVWKSRVITFSS